VTLIALEIQGLYDFAMMLNQLEGMSFM